MNVTQTIDQEHNMFQPWEMVKAVGVGITVIMKNDLEEEFDATIISTFKRVDMFGS